MPSKTHGGDTSHPLFPHGSYGGYKAGCRCEKCCEAKREYSREKAKQYREDPAKRSKMREAVAKYRSTAQGREVNRRCAKTAQEKYRASKHGRAARCAEVAKRRAKVRKATTGNLALIRAIYEARPDGYHVDHIVPLAHGGEHHEDNLQYLPARENAKKQAKLDYVPQGALDWRDMLQ